MGTNNNHGVEVTALASDKSALNHGEGNDLALLCQKMHKALASGPHGAPVWVVPLNQVQSRVSGKFPVIPSKRLGSSYSAM